MFKLHVVLILSIIILYQKPIFGSSYSCNDLFKKTRFFFNYSSRYKTNFPILLAERFTLGDKYEISTEVDREEFGPNAYSAREIRSTISVLAKTNYETWLREIFDNLIANSKYTHPVGREYGAVVVKFKDGRRFVGVVSGTEHSISGRPIFSMLNKSVRRWFFPIWSDVQQITIAHTHPDYKGEKIIAFHSDLDLIFGDFLKKYIRKKSGRDIPIRSLVLPLGINENLVFESNL